MTRQEFVSKLDQYNAFHDSYIRRITIQTALQSVVLEIDHAYDKVLSQAGDVVIPSDEGGVPERYQNVYRPMIVSFKRVEDLAVRMESDLVNDEVILSCEVVDENPTNDSCRVILLLSSMSKLDFYCRDFECRLSSKQ